MAIPKSDLGDGAKRGVTTADRLRTELAATQAGERELRQTLQLETSLITESATDVTNVIRATEQLQRAEAERDAQAIYEQSVASAEGTYRLALTEATKRLEHGLVRASASFEAAIGLADHQYRQIADPAKAAYDRQIDLALAVRLSVVNPAAAEYLAATRRLASEYADHVGPSREEYERGLKRAGEARSTMLQSSSPLVPRGHETARPPAVA